IDKIFFGHGRAADRGLVRRDPDVKENARARVRTRSRIVLDDDAPFIAHIFAPHLFGRAPIAIVDLTLIDQMVVVMRLRIIDAENVWRHLPVRHLGRSAARVTKNAGKFENSRRRFVVAFLLSWTLVWKNIVHADTPSQSVFSND